MKNHSFVVAQAMRLTLGKISTVDLGCEHVRAPYQSSDYVEGSSARKLVYGIHVVGVDDKARLKIGSVSSDQVARDGYPILDYLPVQFSRLDYRMHSIDVVGRCRNATLQPYSVKVSFDTR